MEARGRVEAAAPRWRDWWREGVRSAFLLRPRCEGWQEASPTLVFALMALLVAAGVAIERLAMEPPLIFNPPALASGWFTAVLTIAVCWCVARGARQEPAPAAAPAFAPAEAEVAPPSALPTITLLLLSLVQTLFIGLITGPVVVGLLDPLTDWVPDHADAISWTLWLAPVAWGVLATGVLLWRQAMGRVALRALVVAAAVLNVAAAVWAPPLPYWYPAENENGSTEGASISAGAPQFSQEVLEAQADTLPDALEALQPRRPGVVNLYAVTFAPYADADVFSREATLVSDLIRSRFDAEGHVVQMQNHTASMTSLPWATPLNLQRSIEHIAGLMDRDEDVLFIHLTSHGARDGHLAASFWPLQVDELTPQQLNAWLDAAGIRHRVISISACYSGTWIAPLAGPGSLVMTAADATHTSYGCGRKSELTFFGRAMYAEQLRQTLSFEDAFAAARPVIEQREKDAGKDDGYSNPQISVGPDVRASLQRLRQRLEAEVKPAS